MKLLIKFIPYAKTLYFVSIALNLSFPELTFANIGFGDIGNNITENTMGLAEAGKFFGYMCGIFFAVWGCIDVYNASQGRGSSTYTGGGIKFAVGALLMSIIALLSSTSITIWGTDQTSGVGELGL